MRIIISLFLASTEFPSTQTFQPKNLFATQSRDAARCARQSRVCFRLLLFLSFPFMRQALAVNFGYLIYCFSCIPFFHTVVPERPLPLTSIAVSVAFRSIKVSPNQKCFTRF